MLAGAAAVHRPERPRHPRPEAHRPLPPPLARPPGRPGPARRGARFAPCPAIQPIASTPWTRSPMRSAQRSAIAPRRRPRRYAAPPSAAPPYRGRWWSPWARRPARRRSRRGALALQAGRRPALGRGRARRSRAGRCCRSRTWAPPADQYFADGLTEEITSRLAGLSGLRVISRTSADQYRTSAQSVRAIGAELGADYVLEGSVRWARADGGRGRLRVTPQLIRVADDSHLWAGDVRGRAGGGVPAAVGDRGAGDGGAGRGAPGAGAGGAGGGGHPQPRGLRLLSQGNDYVGRTNHAGDLRGGAICSSRRSRSTRPSPRRRPG